MTVKEMKNTYETNKIVLEKLYDLLKNNTTVYDMEVVEGAIDKILEEQNNISKKLKNQIYKNVNSNMKNELMKKTVKKVDYSKAYISFDGSKYKLFNKDKIIYEYTELVENNSGISYDFNIIRMLKLFDKENKTNLYEKYMTDNMKVIYDFRNYNKNDRKKVNCLKIIANNGKNYNNNIEIIDNSKRKLRNKILIGALALTTVFTGMFINSNKKNNKVINSTELMTIEETYTSDNTTENIDINKYNNLSTESIEKIKEELNTKSDLKNVEKISGTNDYAIDSEDITENNSAVIGDIISLNNNVDLYYASTDEMPRGNTSYLNSNNYKIGLISVVYENRVVMLLSEPNVSLEEIKNECKNKYGNQVKVFVNLDLVDENDNVLIKYAGWVNSDDLNSKSKVLVK